MTVVAYLGHRNVVIWLVLVGLSFTSVFVLGGPSASVFLLVIAAFKARVIMMEFMMLRQASIVVRCAVEVWWIGLCAGLAGVSGIV